MPPPVIPDRTSSKRLLETNDQLDTQLSKVREDFKKIKSNLKPKTSFDSEYWAQTVQIAALGKTSSQLELHKAANNYVAVGQKSEEDFMKPPIADPLNVQVKFWESERKVYRTREIEMKVSSKNPERRSRHVSMQLFTSSPLGLGIRETMARRRDAKNQSDFKSEVLRQYDVVHPDTPNKYWNMISRQYEPRTAFTASHIVACRHGQEMMTAIFVLDAKGELFSASNGLMLPTLVEEQFDNGMMAIVPAIKNPSSKAEVALWLNQEPRKYKINFFDNARRALDEDVYDDMSSGKAVPVKFRDLHNQELHFRGNFRPRARYLYFHYCCQVLRNAWSKGANVKSLSTMQGEHRVFAWGTVGKYMAEDQMRAFLEELGHEYKPLMANADPALEIGAERHVFVDAAARQVSLGAKKELKDAGSWSDDDMRVFDDARIGAIEVFGK
ncbi:KatG, Catalase (peroxidase I) [Pyrenophora tritici-repentis]|nr:KatG, Catalase (peroxidase I) [Pyrenophora tritici-repentis]